MIGCFGADPSTRYLTLTYTCYLTNLPGSAKLVDCWIPIPSSNDRQTVEILSVEPGDGRITTEFKYGNQMYYRHFDLTGRTPTDTIRITLTYKIKLSEKSVAEALSNVYLTLSHGRDVVLEPAQQGPPLNIFADPYTEVDGKYFTGVKWMGSFQEEDRR